jgi:tRNA G46 methylase TrmB
MQHVSRTVSSTQRGVHPRLANVVARHRDSVWRKPPQRVDLPALAALDGRLEDHQGALILDSFCGTGHSSLTLAERNPEALIVGIDQSGHRLRRRPGLANNCLLLHAHCEAVWRHLAARGQRLAAHYLLYPNPWPKPGQLNRRIHGHPAFPMLLTLGGRLELRSNWQIYVEEFGVALHLLGVPARIAVVPEAETLTTLFERKYRGSGQDLWRLNATLKPDSKTDAR